MLKQHKYLLFNIFFVFVSMQLFCEVRYVSKTGNSTAPYTTWETACDSLQKCFDYCLSGDTVYVNRGIYKETIVVTNKNITIIGIDTDECIIDGTGIEGKVNKYNLCYFKNSDMNINNITLKKKKIEESVNYYAMFFSAGNCTANNCIIDSTLKGFALFGVGNITNTIIKNVYVGITIGYTSNYYNIKNNVFHILPYNSFTACIYSPDGQGKYEIFNNIMITEPLPLSGTAVNISTNKSIKINNNLIYGFRFPLATITQSAGAIDTTFILNNTIVKSEGKVIEIGNLPKPFVIKNNLFTYINKGVYNYGNPGISDYNMFFANTNVMYQNMQPGANDIVADPMYFNDTTAVLGGTYNFRLQKYSPAIDRGDPDILDVDATRSDMGMYGGPLGESYMYEDYAPKPVKGLKAVYEEDTCRVKLTWKRNSELDFKQYYVYKDIIANFVPDSTKRINITTDSLFYDTLPKGTFKVYYKITAVDNTGNEGRPGTEVNVTITKNERVNITNNYEYALYQNYPNPFNPNTTIIYSLKEQGEVRIKLYTVTGELLKTLIEGNKNKGYNETKIDMTGFTSGIYLYRLEITGAGKIPVFNDLKKMVFLK